MTIKRKFLKVVVAGTLLTSAFGLVASGGSILGNQPTSVSAASYMPSFYASGTGFVGSEYSTMVSSNKKQFKNNYFTKGQIYIGQYSFGAKQGYVVKRGTTKKVSASTAQLKITGGIKLKSGKFYNSKGDLYTGHLTLIKKNKMEEQNIWVYKGRIVGYDVGVG